MRAGLLRDRVTLEQLGSGQDSYGAPSQVWSVFAVVAAQITPMGGNEVYAQQQIQPKSLYDIRIRYLPGVNEKMRVRGLNGLLFDILNVENFERRNRELILHCKQGVNQG